MKHKQALENAQHILEIAISRQAKLVKEMQLYVKQEIDTLTSYQTNLNVLHSWISHLGSNRPVAIYSWGL
jgi:sialic acid synthase SpsE